MPPLGWRDESKRLEKSLEKSQRELRQALGDCLRGDNTPKTREEYVRLLRAERRDREFKAFLKMRSYKGEPDLTSLVMMVSMAVHDGITLHAAAQTIANELGSGAAGRRAIKKRLYDKFRKAPVLYHRLAALAPELALDDPAYHAIVKGLDSAWFHRWYTEE
jgi:hypothetical protein